MLALLATVLLFVFLGLLGKAVMEAVRFRFPILRSWLLAPSVVTAVVVLLVLNISQAGLAVDSFAPWLTAGLALFTLAVFLWRRPFFPWRQLRIFLGIAFCSALYTCWPMFLYGFRWAGYMNADLGTYALGATRLLHYGFYRIPTVAELTGTDYSQFWWFHLGPGLFRCGADLFLAWAASISRLEPLRVSMPLIAAANLTQLFAAAALILTRPTKRRLAILASALLAISPFFLFSALAQLLPQIGGFALFLGLSVLLLRPLTLNRKWAFRFGDIFLAVLLGTAVCIWYPETTPFVAISAAAYHGYQVLRRKETIRQLVAYFSPVAVLFLIVARQGVLTALGTLLQSFSSGENLNVSRSGFSDFDTMLDPSVFASLFGFETYYGYHVDPWISVAILAGIFLLLSALIIAVYWCVKGEPFAFLLLAMLGLGLQLFHSHSSFGVFKLALFIQPLLVVALATLAIRLAKERYRLAPALYLAATVFTGLTYVARSTELTGSPSVLLPGIQTADIATIHPPVTQRILMDTPNKTGDYVFAAASVGANTQWATIDNFKGFSLMLGVPPALHPLPARLGLTKDYLSFAKTLQKEIYSDVHTETILGQKTDLVEHARTNLAYLGHRAWDPWTSSNNRAGRQTGNDYLVFQKISDVQNYLIDVPTDKGGPHFLSAATSRWAPEPDFYRPNHTFYAIGRYLLFEVLNPTDNVRLHINVSRSLLGLGRTALPLEARVNAEEPQHLPFEGSGSANVITQPLKLLHHDGRYYFALDFGMDGDYFPNRKTGLMRLFNVDIRPDPRRIVGFCRDISLVTDSEYTNLRRPEAIETWPDGLLQNPSLEYSGVYEDGWMSDRAYLALGKAKAGDTLVIGGTIPNFGKVAKSGNMVQIALNGRPIYANWISPGTFKIAHAITEDLEVTRVEFAFSAMVALPGADGRPVAAQLSRIAIINGSEISVATKH